MWFRELLPSLIISLILTVLFYTGPILIYRFLIRKTPMNKKNGIITTVVYGIVMYAIMWTIIYAIAQTGANAAACTTWSFVNYFVLTREADKLPLVGGLFRQNNNVSSAQSTVNKEVTFQAKVIQSKSSNQICFCRKCGKRAIENSKFCNVCGSRLNWD